MIDPEVKRRVLERIESMRAETVKLVSDTVKIPSVNPWYAGQVYEETLGGETRVNEFLKPVMKSVGLETDMWEVEKGRANLVGTYKGAGGGRSLIFNGHVDVVPPGPDALWTVAGPWSGEIVNNRLYGRGSIDMKAGNSAAIKALDAILKAGIRPKGDIFIEDVVGEEMMNTEAGTGATIARGYKADAGIVVEPSGPPYRLGIIPASPGTLYLRITVKGKPTHCSMRDELVRAGGRGAAVGVNSIDKAMIVYDALNKLEQEWGQTKSHPVFTRPGHFAIHPGVFTGGPDGPFVISEESRLEYAVWHPPQDTDVTIKKEIEDQIARFVGTDPWLRENPPKVEWLMWWPPYDVPVDAPICKAVESAYEQALGEPAKYYGFAAVDDASFLNLAGIPTISLGPGDLTVAHAANEYLNLDELLDATKIYAMSILEWCGY